MNEKALRAWVRGLILLTLMALVLGAPASAQKNKKDKEKEKEAATTPIIPLSAISDNDQIDQALTEILAGWQIGEVALMQKHYSPDAVFVSGGYEPPVVGWTNYLNSYQAQRQRMSNITMNRFNTLVRVKGTSAVSNYQWQFTALVDGKNMWARGHATLVWEKKDGKWLVQHNHTSLVDQGPPQPAQPAPAKQPAKQP